MKLSTMIFAFIGCALGFTACDYNKSDILPDCATVPARFAADVQPIIHSKCDTACHNAFSTNRGGPLNNYTQIKAKADLVKFMVETRNMPQVGSLTDAEIKVISCWVEAGAENN